MKAHRKPEPNLGPQALEVEETPSHPAPAALGERVLQALGQPQRLYAVQVRRLWDDHYRVNVFVQRDEAAVAISDSFFLVTDPDGNILASTPELTRQY